MSEINIILSATDQASGTIQQVAANTTASMNEIQGASQAVTNATEKTTASSREVAVAFSNVATGAFSLYMSMENVQRANVMLDRANLMVQRSTEAVEKAQTAYNAAVAKYGPNSAQAKEAADKLSIAEEAHTVALERADLAQQNVSNSMLRVAVTVIPSVITMISGVSTITASWTAVTEGASGALGFLAANPIVLVVVGIAALAAGLIWAYQNCEPFRNAINALGGALKWVWDTIFAPFVTWLVSGFVKLCIEAFTALKAGWEAVCAAFGWVYNNVLKPIFDAVLGAIRAITNFFGTGGGGTPAGGGGGAAGGGAGAGAWRNAWQNWKPPGAQEGGIITQPTLLWAGEAGPEAIIPLNRPSIDQYMPVSKSGAGDIVIQGPVVNVEGSVDRATAEYAARLVQDTLKNVLVEASSSSAGSTHKRIRMGI